MDILITMAGHCMMSLPARSNSQIRNRNLTGHNFEVVSLGGFFFRRASLDRHCLERDAARENQPVIIRVILRCSDLHSNSNSKAQAVFGIVRQANFAHH